MNERISCIYIDTLFFKGKNGTIFRIYEKNFAYMHANKFIIEGTAEKIIKSPLFKNMKKRVFNFYIENNKICMEVY